MSEPSYPDTASQTCPFPTILASLVERCTYREGWTVRLQEDRVRQDGSKGLTLVVSTLVVNSYSPSSGLTYRNNHNMRVPSVAYNEKAWQRWLLQQFLLIEQHECCEFFRIDGKRIFAPQHGPGTDPYTILFHGTDLDKSRS